VNTCTLSKKKERKRGLQKPTRLAQQRPKREIPAKKSVGARAALLLELLYSREKEGQAHFLGKNRLVPDQEVGPRSHEQGGLPQASVLIAEKE